MTTYLQKIQGLQKGAPHWGAADIRAWILNQYGVDISNMQPQQLLTEIPGTPLTKDPGPQWQGPPMSIPEEPPNWVPVPQTQYTPEDLAALRGTMEGPPSEEFIVSPEESAQILAQGVEEPRWPQPVDPNAAAKAQALRTEREAAARELRPEEFFEFQYPPGTTTPAAYREMLREPGRQYEYYKRRQGEEQARKLARILGGREQPPPRGESPRAPMFSEFREPVQMPQQPTGERSTKIEIGGETYEYDPTVQRALDYDRGELVPEAGKTARETLIAQAGGAPIPEDLPGDFADWAGTVTGRLVWTPAGVGEWAGETVVDAQLIKSDIYAYEIHRKAAAAKRDGRVFIDAQTPDGKEVRYNVDDVILADEKQAEMAARINSRGWLLKEQLTQQREHLNELLEDDPEFISWYTAELWRNNIGDLIKGLGQFVVYGSGAYPLSKEESEARGFIDNFFAAENASKFFGASMAAGLTASYANLMTNTEQKIQTEGPTVILDALMFYSALKAGALKSGVKLPDGVVEIGTKLEKLAEPLVERVKSSKPADWWVTAKRNLVDNAYNTNQIASNLTTDLQKNAVNYQRAIENTLKNMAPMVEAGDMRLAPREGPVVVIRDVPSGRTGPRGETLTRPVGILADEMELFEATRDAALRQRMKELNFTRDVGAEGGTVRMPSGVESGQWRYSKKPTEYDLTPEQMTLWEDELAQALPELTSFKRRKGQASGRKTRKRWKQLKDELEAIAAGKRDRAGVAPEEVAQAELASATKHAAQTVVERRSPWGSRKDDPVPIETERYTEVVNVYPLETTGRRAKAEDPLTAAGQQKTIIEAYQEGRTPAEVSKELAQRGGEGPFKGGERRGDAPDYVVTPHLELTDEAARIFQELGDTVTGGGEASTRFVSDLKANVARSIDDNLPELLRSKKFRDEVAEDVTNIAMSRADVPEGMRGKIRDSIARELEEKQARSTPDSGAPGSDVPVNVLFKIKDEAGNVLAEVDLFGEVSKRVLNNPEVRKQVMTESVMHTARRAGLRRSQQHVQETFLGDSGKAFDRRWTSYNAQAHDKPTYLTEFIRSAHTYLDTGDLPATLAARVSQMQGLANMLADGKASAIPGFKKGFGIEELRKILAREGVEIGANALKRKLRNMELRLGRYDDLGSADYSAARRYLRVGDDLYEAVQAQRAVTGGSRLADPRRGVGIQPKPLQYRGDPGDGSYTSIYMDKQAARALDNFSIAKEAVEGADNWLHGNAFIKSNLTAAQLTTLKNNVLSNYFLQALRRGAPFHPGSVFEAVAQYKRWQSDPKAVSPRDRRIFESISRTGKIETSVVDAEIAAHSSGGGINWLWRKGLISGDTARILQKVGAPRKMLEDTYRFSDDAMKIEEGRWGFNVIEKALDRLEDGKMLELETGYNQRVSLRKIGPGKFEVGTGRGRNFKKRGEVEAGSRLDDIIAKASMRSGDKLFFDYFDIPDFPRRIRTSKAAALASPFFTWLNKSMDVPGFKKGLLSELYSGGPSMWTDSAGAQVGIAQRAARAAATANMALQAQSQTPYTEKEAKLLQKTMGWGTNPLVALGGIEDGVISTYNLTSSNPFQGADLVFQAAEQALHPNLSTYNEALSKMSGSTGSPLSMFPEQEELLAAYRSDPEGILDFELEGETPENRKEIRARRKFLIEKLMGKRGITLSNTLDLFGFAGHPFLELWHMSEEAEKRGRRPSLDNRAQRFLGMLFGGTYVKAADALIGAIDPKSPLTTRYSRADPELGEEEELLTWALRHIVGIGWTKRNFHKRDERYFKAVKQSARKGMIEPINKRIDELKGVASARMLGSDVTTEARDDIGKLLRLKGMVEQVINRELGMMQAEHLKILKRHQEAE